MVDFPVIVAIDSQGNNLYQEAAPAFAKKTEKRNQRAEKALFLRLPKLSTASLKRCKGAEG